MTRERQCAHCGAMYYPRAAHQVYCCEECASGARTAQRARRRRRRRPSCTRYSPNYPRTPRTPARHWRPATRADCVDGERPCPYVGCKHHLYLEVTPSAGAIMYRHGDRELWELEETCALDVADRGGEDVETVARLCGMAMRTTERTLAAALGKMRRSDALRQYHAELEVPADDWRVRPLPADALPMELEEEDDSDADL